MSLSLSRPAASIRRKEKISVPLPGEPVDTRLPLRSSNLVMPLPSTVTTCIRLEYMTTSARTGSFLGKRSRPFSASTAVSTCVKAISALPEPISFMLSSEPPVTSAVAVMPDSSLPRMAAKPPASG